MTKKDLRQEWTYAECVQRLRKPPLDTPTDDFYPILNRTWDNLPTVLTMVKKTSDGFTTTSDVQEQKKEALVDDLINSVDPDDVWEDSYWEHWDSEPVNENDVVDGHPELWALNDAFEKAALKEIEDSPEYSMGRGRIEPLMEAMRVSFLYRKTGIFKRALNFFVTSPPPSSGIL